MRLPQLRVALPWLIGLSLLASLGCLVLAVWLGLAARTDAMRQAGRRLAAQGESLARRIDADMAQYDLVLRDAARLGPGGDATAATSNMPLLDLPLTARYIGFINVLNEVGDVVADPRSNVSRPANFVGRDYFQDHLKNPADIVMIGRPFATAPTQHASIPISRRINRPDGAFAGVVVAGVHLTWLSDLLSHPSPDPSPFVTIRRDDGLILMRTPYDADAIGRAGTADPAWRNYLRTGVAETANDAGIHLFRRLGTPALVLELAEDRSDIAAGDPSWLLWLPLLTLTPGLCILGLSFAGWRLLRRGIRAEAEAGVANDECMRLLANMSHELRTPLTGILGQAELLTDEGGLSESQADRLARLTAAGTLMRNVVDRVINIARPDEVATAPVLEPCDIDSLIHDCLAMVEHEARRKGVLLTSTVSASAQRRAMLDRDRVRQMVINLLMNAVKYTTRGSVALRVSGDASLLRIEVADTGPGIPPDKRWRLFRAYDRIDAADFASRGLGPGAIDHATVCPPHGRSGWPRGKSGRREPVLDRAAAHATARRANRRHPGQRGAASGRNPPFACSARGRSRPDPRRDGRLSALRRSPGHRGSGRRGRCRRGPGPRLRRRPDRHADAGGRWAGGHAADPCPARPSRPHSGRAGDRRPRGARRRRVRDRPGSMPA